MRLSLLACLLVLSACGTSGTSQPSRERAASMSQEERAEYQRREVMRMRAAELEVEQAARADSLLTIPADSLTAADLQFLAGYSRVRADQAQARSGGVSVLGVLGILFLVGMAGTAVALLGSSDS